MISTASLTNRRRRFRELRNMHGRLRTLKRRRFARKVLSRKINDDLAILHLFDRTKEFLDCTFSTYNDTNDITYRAVARMRRAIDQMKKECQIAANAGRAIQTSSIRQFGSAATNLYQSTRRLPINWSCDELWNKLGLCAHIMF